MKHKAEEFKINVRDEEMITGNNKKRWTQGKNVTGAVSIKTPKGYLEWPVQLLYPSELSTDNDGNINNSKEHQLINISNKGNGTKINVNAPEFKSNKTAAAVASIKIKNVRESESDSD